MIYAWRQQLIDSGQIPGITSGDPSPLLYWRLTYTNWRGRLPVNALVRYGDRTHGWLLLKDRLAAQRRS